MKSLIRASAGWRDLFFSMADQALLSLVNLGIALCFIRFADKGTYFAYSQLISLLALNAALQTALINSPALTLLPAMQAGEQRRALAGLQSVQWLLALGMGGLCMALVVCWPRFGLDQSVLWQTAAIFGVMVIANWAREFLRTTQFVRMRADLCLAIDLIYCLLLLPTVGYLVSRHAMSAGAVFAGMALSGLLTVAGWSMFTRMRPAWSMREVQDWWGRIWPMAKWGLPATLVAWAFGDGFIYIGGTVLGGAEMADVVAARLFVAPLNMAFVALGNIFRPRVSRSLAARDVHKASWWMHGALVGIVLGVLVFGGLLALVYPLLSQHVLGEKYAGLGPLVMLWLVFSVLSGSSSVCNGVLQAGGFYRSAFAAGSVASVASLSSVYVLALHFGRTGVLVGVIIGEAVFALMLYLRVRRELKAGPPSLAV